MSKFLIMFGLIVAISSCSNTAALETGEIKALQLLKNAINQPKKAHTFIDARDLLSREQIDVASIPVLFVELESGQNGTLTPYPGQGVGQTWLGADGATITLEQGILKATRGMGDDIMGGSSSMPPWGKLDIDYAKYSREVFYITGNNQISKHIMECKIKKNNKTELIKIWQVIFRVTKYIEKCDQNGEVIENIYFVDGRKIVRKSSQYHSTSIGYIYTARLDR